MEYSKTTEYIDIHAPREEVFQVIVNIERRMQLSPLWGVATIESLPDDYPQVGSTYLVRHKPVEPEEQVNTPEHAVELVPVSQLAAESTPEPIIFQSVVTAYEPPYKISYCLDVDQQTSVTWNVSEIAAGTRLTYTEEYVVDPEQAEEFNAAVRVIVKEWLKNIKNYAELRDDRLKVFVRWVFDRFYLKLGIDQRKVVALILFMHITGIITFILAALAFAVGSLLF